MAQLQLPVSKRNGSSLIDCCSYRRMWDIVGQAQTNCIVKDVGSWHMFHSIFHSTFWSLHTTKNYSDHPCRWSCWTKCMFVRTVCCAVILCIFLALIQKLFIILYWATMRPCLSDADRGPEKKKGWPLGLWMKQPLHFACCYLAHTRPTMFDVT